MDFPMKQSCKSIILIIISIKHYYNLNYYVYAYANTNYLITIFQLDKQAFKWSTYDAPETRTIYV